MMILPPLKPRVFQLASWRAYQNPAKKFHLLSIHRRGGKDITHFQQTVCDAVVRGGTHFYLFPTLANAVRAIWDMQFEVNGVMKRFIEWCIPDVLAYQLNKKDYMITFPHNGAVIRFGGTDNLEFVGQGGASYTLSEFSKHREEVTGFIMPIVRQANAPLRMNGTLRGRENPLWEMLEKNKDHPDWFCQWLRPQDTKCYCWVDDEFQINPELLPLVGQPGPNGPIFNVADDIRSGAISHAFAMQEYLNEPILASEHGYLLCEYKIAEAEGRINAPIRYDRNLPVFTFWDLGQGTAQKSTDSMVIWFAQFPDEDYPAPKKTHIIGWHQSVGKDWAEYAQILNSKGYWYGGHFAPWDIRSGRAGWGEKKNLDFARERGIEFRVVDKTPSFAADVELCRRHMPHCWFSEDVTIGAETLASWHQKMTRDNVPAGAEEHNMASNSGAAFRTLVRAIDRKMVVPSAQRCGDFSWFDAPKFDGYFEV